MTCKLDHSDPGMIPPFLCRACHPELNRSPDQLAALDAADRAARQAADRELSRQREISRTLRDVERLEARKPDPESVSGKIAASLRRKLKRLTNDAIT